MPSPSDFTEEYLEEYVRTKLGYPVIQVELDDAHIEMAIRDSIELFQKYRPLQYIQGQLMAKGTYLISPPEDSMGVLDIDYSVQNQLDSMSVEAALLYDPFYFISSGAIGGVDIQLYDMTRRWMELVGRVFSAEFDWESTDDGLFMYIPQTAKVKIVWAMPYDGLSDIRREYQTLFQDLVVAKSRQILGDIRNKYGGIPGAGTVVQLDGATQKQQGMQEEQTITDELKRISPHYIPSYG